LADKLEFWGENCLIELSKMKLRVYLGRATANPLLQFTGGIKLFSTLRDLLKPALVIPLYDIYRVDKISDRAVSISWRKREGIITKTVKNSFELHPSDADRLIKAVNELLRGTSFEEVYSKYSIKLGAMGEVIRDENQVVIIKYADQTITFMNPKAYEAIYGERKYRAEVFVDKIFMLDLSHISLIDITNIKFEDIGKIAFKCCDFRGRYIIKITLRDGTKHTFKFKSYGAAMKVLSRLNEIIGKLGPVEVRSRPIRGIIAVTLASFIMTFTSAILLWEAYLSALPISVLIAVMVFIALWRLTESK